MQRKSIRRHRRRFLKQAGLAAGAGALLVLGPGPRPHADADGAATPPRKDRGYRLTAHIRDYYRNAGL